MVIANIVSYILVGDRSVGAIIAYVIIALAAIWLILSTIFSGGILRFRANRPEKANA